MPYFRDLREYLAVLESENKLAIIDRPIDKDREMMPLVRWQFRGVPEPDRRAFLFTHPTDSNGEPVPGRALISCYAPSREIYAMGLKSAPKDLGALWRRAQQHPIPPRQVEGPGACQEVVHEGAGLLEEGGFLEFPIPNSTPGFDNAPYLSASHWITKDPETGIYNVGTYRAMIKDKDFCGANSTENQHMAIHRRKWRNAGYKKMPAAIVLGVLPNLAFCSVAGLPYGVSEYDVAGGLAGEALDLVRCRTVDLWVPAGAEIIIEGEIDTEWVERDGPFGEFTGYMGKEKITPAFQVTCITHRKDPIYVGFLSEFPPSESSKMKQVAYEAIYLNALKNFNMPNVLDVAFWESGASWAFCVMQMKKTHPSQPWQALHAAAGFHTYHGKFFIVVDEDIDPHDADSVNWAIAFRVQPHRDMEIVRGRVSGLDPSGAPPDQPDARYPNGPLGGSALLIDATRKFDMPPVSLPKKEFMERALEIWKEEGLGPLTPKVPWHGYSLGYWTEELDEEARLAVTGRYFETGAKVRSTTRRRDD